MNFVTTSTISRNKKMLQEVFIKLIRLHRIFEFRERNEPTS